MPLELVQYSSITNDNKITNHWWTYLLNKDKYFKEIVSRKKHREHRYIFMMNFLTWQIIILVLSTTKLYNTLSGSDIT